MTAYQDHIASMTRLISGKNGTWDGIEDAKDEAIFFYTEGKPIIGDHGDFVVTSAAVYDYLGDV